MIKAMYIFIGVAFIAALVSLFLAQSASAPVATPTPVPDPVEVMCTADAMQCPDGSYVGRTGPSCAFVCPEASVPVEQDNSDMIVLASPVSDAVVTSPLTITGQARGGWYFEASFPVVLTNWDGLIIAEGPATAQGDWMTSEFVPFTASLTYINPYTAGDPDFMKRGTLILKNDNPSGLSENDRAIEIPVRFAP
jgi:Immunoglobulin-like domain of bacterial spore germination